MTRRIPLPDGGWAEIRDPSELTTRGRRGIQAISASLGRVLPALQAADAETPIASLGFTEAEMDAFFRLQEATLVAFLVSWSRPEPIPTLSTVGDMTAELYDAISEASAQDGAKVAAIGLDMGVGDGTPDPKDLSGNSDNSDGPSKEGPEPTPALT